LTQQFDLQDMAPELDPEDQELLAMFPRNRECRLNDMVLTIKGEKHYLERKADIAIRRKRARTALHGAIGLLACICLASAIKAALSGAGSSWAWLAGFEACILPWLLKVPAAVKI